MKRVSNGENVNVNDVLTRTIVAKEIQVIITDVVSMTVRIDTFYTANKVTNSALHKRASELCNENEVVTLVRETGNSIEKLMAITIADFLDKAFEVER